MRTVEEVEILGFSEDGGHMFVVFLTGIGVEMQEPMHVVRWNAANATIMFGAFNCPQ